MPNPKGNPDNLKPFSSDRNEPLVGRLAVRVTKSMEDKVKSIDNYAEFLRQAIAKALSDLEGEDDEIT